MSFEEALDRENWGMAVEFMAYGCVVGLVFGVVGTLFVQGVFQ